MKKSIIYFLSLIMSLITVSCVDEIVKVEVDGSDSENLVPMVFSASSQEDTKTTLVDNIKIWWLPEDNIDVNGYTFWSSHTESVPTTTFEGELVPSDEYFALYGNGHWTGESYTVYMPDTQRLVKGNFPMMVFPSSERPAHMSVARCTSPSTELHFSTILGYVKFTITEESGDITKVTVATMADESISGFASVEFTSDGVTVTPTEKCPVIVAESAEPLEPGDYYIAMYPGVYSSGIRIIIESADGEISIKTISKELELESGVIQSIGTLDGFEDLETLLASERNALLAFYESTGGDSWMTKNNWCSDKPVSEWYGVNTDEYGFVTGLTLHFNNLAGNIPDDIYDLSSLKSLNIVQSDTHFGNLTFSSAGRLNSLRSLKTLQLSGIDLSQDLKLFCDLESLETLVLLNCGISGSIPSAISNLKNLTRLEISYNDQLSGTIPTEICDLVELLTLDLSNNNLSGTLPASIGNLSNLEILRLYNNKFTGTFPSSLSQIMSNINKYDMYLEGNMFSGRIPQEIVSHPRFEEFWPRFLNQSPDGNGNRLDLSDLDIPAPAVTVTTMNGDVISLKDHYAENELTVLYLWASWCPYSQSYTTSLIPMFNAYKSKGLSVLGHALATSWVSPTDNIPDVENAISKLGIEWDNIVMYDQDSGDPVNYIPALFMLPGVPSIVVVDNEGHIVHNMFMNTDKTSIELLPEILEEYLGEAQLESPEIYESSDYSKDGEVIKLQSATEGEGIDVVLMGDGFTDMDMDKDGVYETLMKKAANELFSEEPMKSFREYFNVYVVKAVSKHNIISDNTETVFDTWFGAGTSVGGEDSICFEYASKVDGIDMTESIVICIMNQKYYAGTCYMYFDDSNVSYFPLGFDDSMFSQLLNHEAIGHGFGKLLDEYEDNLGYITLMWMSLVILLRYSGQSS